jgi:hypothetical protein
MINTCHNPMIASPRDRILALPKAELKMQGANYQMVLAARLPAIEKGRNVQHVVHRNP